MTHFLNMIRTCCVAAVVAFSTSISHSSHRSWFSHGSNGSNSVQFSRSLVSDSLRPCGLQHARPPCPSPTPRIYSNSGPLSWWCHTTISSSVIPFSSWFQCFPASGAFPMSQFFASGGQSIGVSASASVLPMNIQDWFPLGWTGWVSLHVMLHFPICSTWMSQDKSLVDVKGLL